MFQIAHAGAAIFFLNRDAKHAKIAEFAPESGGEIIALVYIRSTWRDFSRGEARYLISQHIGGFTQIEIEPRKAVRDNGHV